MKKIVLFIISTVAFASIYMPAMYQRKTKKTTLSKYLAAASENGLIKIWDWEKNTLVKTIHVPMQDIKKVLTVSFKHQLLAAVAKHGSQANDTIIIFDWKNNRVIQRLQVPNLTIGISKTNQEILEDKNDFVTAQFSPHDPNLIIIARIYGFGVFDIAKNKQVCTQGKYGEQRLASSFSFDPKYPNTFVASYPAFHAIQLSELLEWATDGKSLMLFYELTLPKNQINIFRAKKLSSAFPVIFHPHRSNKIMFGHNTGKIFLVKLNNYKLTQDFIRLRGNIGIEGKTSRKRPTITALAFDP